MDNAADQSYASPASNPAMENNPAIENPAMEADPASEGDPVTEKGPPTENIQSAEENTQSENDPTVEGSERFSEGDDGLDTNELRMFYDLFHSMIAAAKTNTDEGRKFAEDTAKSLLNYPQLPLLIRARACKVLAMGSSPGHVEWAREAVRVAELAQTLSPGPGEAALLAGCRKALELAEIDFEACGGEHEEEEDDEDEDDGGGDAEQQTEEEALPEESGELEDTAGELPEAKLTSEDEPRPLVTGPGLPPPGPTSELTFPQGEPSSEASHTQGVAGSDATAGGDSIMSEDVETMAATDTATGGGASKSTAQAATVGETPRRLKISSGGAIEDQDAVIDEGGEMETSGADATTAKGPAGKNSSSELSEMYESELNALFEG